MSECLKWAIWTLFVQNFPWGHAPGPPLAWTLAPSALASHRSPCLQLLPYTQNHFETPVNRCWIHLLATCMSLQVNSISCILFQTRSTQRAQTSLAEADHYSHIVHCKMLSLGCERLPTPLKKKKKKKKRFWIITFTTIWVCYHYYGVFFAHLLILQYPDHHQNLISSYLYYSGPVHKISSQSVHNFLSNVVHRQTNKQTDKPTLPKT